MGVRSLRGEYHWASLGTMKAPRAAKDISEVKGSFAAGFSYSNGAKGSEKG
jgi:hypothetical protein